MISSLVIATFAILLPAQSYRVTTVAGRNPVMDSRPPMEATLETPAALALDRDGNLYIADASSHAIRKITPDRSRLSAEEKYAYGTITAVAGAGGMYFDGDGGPALDAHLASPNGIALGSDGTLYIADTNNNRVRAVSPEGIIRTVAAGLAVPYGIAIDADGAVYVSELQGGRIRRIEANGTLSTVAEQLVRPMGLAFDHHGNLYIAESGRHIIHKLDRDGVRTPFAGTGTPGFSGEGGPAREAMLALPRTLTIDAQGNVYVTDAGNGFIRRIDPTGVIRRVINLVVPNPMGLAANDEGTLFLSTATGFGGSISLISAGQSTLGSPIAGGSNRGREGVAALDSLLISPTSVAQASDGALLIAQPLQDVIRKVDVEGAIQRYAGNNPGYGGDAGPVDRANLSNTFAVAVDANGNVYLADSSNQRVRRVDPEGIITTVAGNGSRGSAGDGGPATEAELNQPQFVAVDAAGNLYIGEPVMNRIRIVSPEGIIRTLAGTGTRGFSGDGGPAAEAQLAGPQGIAADAEGNVYIADTGNNRIRRVTAAGVIETILNRASPQSVALDASGNLIFTAGHAIYRMSATGEPQRIAGGDTPGFSGDDGPAIDARWNQPGALWITASGDIYVADRGNHRIRLLQPE